MSHLFKYSNMKQAEFLLINDIHVSRDSLQDFQKNWDEALDICKKRGIVDIIIGGDLRGGL